MDAGILDTIKHQFGLGEVDVSSYSPLTLAFIGDCVFDLVVKTVMVENANCQPNKLHRKTSALVKAETQSAMAKWFTDNNILTENEIVIYRRGRNAKSPTTAKNASVGDYRRATGVEALIGYHYLSGNTERFVELIKLGINAVETVHANP